MKPKGSRKNPYTWSEFDFKVIMNQWYGGWVINGGELDYRTAGQLVYTGYCTKSDPVPPSMYSEMQQLGIWLGGWVGYSPDVNYYSTNGIQYNSNWGHTSQEPWPLGIYNEMVSNAMWEGGWVQENDGSAHYIQYFPISLTTGCGCGSGSDSGSDSGSGSGCGSDSGSDSGSGSGSGSEGGGGGGGGGSNTLSYPISAGSSFAGHVNLVEPEISGRLYLSWTDGNTQGVDGLSVASASIEFDDSSYVFQDNNMYTIWEAAYELSVHGTFTVRKGQVVKRFVLCETGTTFLIPQEYYL